MNALRLVSCMLALATATLATAEWTSTSLQQVDLLSAVRASTAAHAAAAQALQLCTQGCDMSNLGDACIGSLSPAPNSPPFTSDSCLVGEIDFLDWSPSAMRALQLTGGPSKGQWVLAFFGADHRACTNVTAIIGTTTPEYLGKCQAAGFSINGNGVSDFIVGTQPGPASSTGQHDPDTSDDGNKSLVIGLAVGGGVVALIVIGVAIWYWQKRRRSREAALDLDTAYQTM